jgi:hypothetical protein
MVKKQKAEELIEKIVGDQFKGAKGFRICEDIEKKNTYQVSALYCEIESGILMFSDPEDIILDNRFFLLARLIKTIVKIEIKESYKIHFDFGSITITALY